MAQEQHKKKGDEAKRPEDDKDAKGAKNVQAKGEELKKKIDDLIDEVDDVLEENAEEFVKSYVQKGGE